ncbi:POPLD-domain-containing protein [Xylona heveae TC161]|uniref:POPLD-domain-containing protein n=1 Tax=Xylona heveae (strain CBS 132557 / TC161) TaxID=1328760 RepID=A0A165FEM0_XYLHT|nr:POPLD-domain-containing protein [Xylona heveae TC161]KZF20890.1 POPLD-domain-containing protein [Xylona heveae TC161]
MAPANPQASSAGTSSLKRSAPGSSRADDSKRAKFMGNKGQQGKDIQRNNKPGANARPNQNSNFKSRRRAKSQDARAIAAQTSDKALNGNGELDVDRFVRAREFEIRALEDSMGRAKGALTTRAFQQVPRNLRRRTASHNVKRVPKRLRRRAGREMAEDNTPTVTARRRELTHHMRLRQNIASRLQRLGEKAKVQKEASQTRDDEQSLDRANTVRLQLPKIKRNTLKAPPKPVSKYRKRQIHKTWLPTHIFHTKRAHLTEPRYPLWRFAIPLRPSEKSYRPTHRASTARGAVAWDMSYMSTIGLEGTETSLEGMLKKLGVGQTAESHGLWEKKGIKWRNGSRTWEGWVYKSNACPCDAIASVTIMWCARNPTSEMATERSSKSPLKRRIFIRVQPSAFLQLWDELVAIAKTQRPQISVEDLRFEIGSIEITGPASTEALLGTLKPSQAQEGGAYTSGSPEHTWLALNGLTNPAALPSCVLLGFNISDPRLHHPPRTVSKPGSECTADYELLRIMASWPPDNSQASPTLFDRTARLTASRQLPSQKAINRRKALALPGQYPEALPKDPRIPIIIYPSRNRSSVQSTWTVLLPWKCVLPVWYSLMYYPLSSGGNVRFGGLNELRQVAFESSSPWFPGDYPGTRAGWEWELQERAKRKDDWTRRPKGKRIEWTSLDLGQGRKGEIGDGWACDWEVLFNAKFNSDSKEQKTTSSSSDEKPAHSLAKSSSNDILSKRTQLPQALHDLGVDTASRDDSSFLRAALCTVRINLLARGVPTSCARIYRLPSNNPALRAKWLSLDPSNPSARSRRKQNKGPKPTEKDNTSHSSHILRRQELAASLLNGVPSAQQRRSGSEFVPQAGDADYPVVPDAEDLIGFVTTGNFNLGQGRATSIGCLSLGNLLDGSQHGGPPGSAPGTLCIVREAGHGIGRLARWELI